MSIIRNTYLTLDLDYWMNHHTDEIYSMIIFLNQIKRCGREIHVVKYHNEVINHIKKFPKVTRLINVDYHSDITDMCVESCGIDDFNEGTWVNYVVGMTKYEYVWRYPFDNEIDLDAGYCHLMESPFSMSLADRKCLGWQRISMIQGLPDANDLMHCEAFCICISPNWAPRNHDTNLVELLVALGILSTHKAHKFREDSKPKRIIARNRRLYRSIHT